MEQNNQLVYIPVDDSFGLRKYKAYYKKGGRYLYCTRKNEDVSVDGLRSIYVGDHFPGLLVRRALAQLDEYLEANRNNTEMYQYDSFWEDALRFAGRPVIPSEPYALDTHVEKGYISIYTSDSYRKERLVYCHYDLLEERLYLKYVSWRRESETPPQDFMDYLFGGLQQQILAQRQLDEGVMPDQCRAAYEEICRINRFMKGKRTVRAWFDGREKGVLCYPRDVQTAAFIIRLEDTKFINYLYNYRHDEQGNIVKPKELASLPCKLSHYSEELTLHPDVFSELKLTASDPKLSHDWRREKQTDAG